MNLNISGPIQETRIRKLHSTNIQNVYFPSRKYVRVIHLRMLAEVTNVYETVQNSLEKSHLGKFKYKWNNYITIYVGDR